MITLDSNSTDMVFLNPKYVTNIRDEGKSLESNTNGGHMLSTKYCDVPHLGTYWYNENLIINIISLADMVKHHQVIFDSDK